MKPTKKHKMVIRPENYSFTVHEGQSLLEVLIRAGILLQSDCGGAGRCGKCQVRVVGAEEKTVMRGYNFSVINFFGPIISINQ